MKRFWLLAAVCMLPAAATAQEKAGRGGIDETMMQEIRKGYTASPADKALRNALAGTALNVLAADAEHAEMPDTHFSDEVKTKGRTDQQSSGRCWLFSGLNVLRARMIEEHGLGAFTFSQNYLFFYDQLEKANLFLQCIIDTRDLPFEDRKVDWLFRNPIGDGGQFTGVSNLVMKYGLVPAEAMPETYASNHTAQMSQRLKTLLREDGLRLRALADSMKALKGAAGKKGAAALPGMLQARKTAMLRDVYRVLALCLGVPPERFTWTRCDAAGKRVSEEEYTPKSFYEKFVGEELENKYVMVMNDPTRPYGKVYEIDWDRHVYDGHNWLYVNLPMDRIKEMAIASIKGGTAMYFSCDVGKELDRKKGVADPGNFDYESLLGVPAGMDKRERILTHASGSSHAMTLIAVDLKDGKPVKWLVENSWGAKFGWKGNIILTDSWFDNYMFRLVVEKKYVPADIQAMLGQKPVLLPAWDPMFAPED